MYAVTQDQTQTPGNDKEHVSTYKLEHPNRYFLGAEAAFCRDTSVLGSSICNPAFNFWAACRLYVSPHRKLQSTIANTTRHPVWDETFQLLVSDHEQDVLTLLLFDHDRVKADEKLGR